MTQAEKLEALIAEAAQRHWVDAAPAMNQLLATPKWAIAGHSPFVMSVLFNHAFARALFGTGQVRYVRDIGPGHYEKWEYVLQLAVISPDPIDYMYKAEFGGEK